MSDSPLKRLVGLRSKDAWLGSAVDAHLAKPSVYKPKEPGWFGVTHIPHTCEAYLAFVYLGVERRETISPRLQRIFDNGHARDKDIKGYLADAGLSIVKDPKERFVALPAYRIRGEYDDRIQRPEIGSTHVVEIKTMNSEQWKQLKAPLNDHDIQVHPYLFATQDPSALFIYENKDTQDWKTYYREFQWTVWADIVNKLERVLQNLRNHTVVRTPAQYESRCPFYWMCSTANIPKLVEDAKANGVPI